MDWIESIREIQKANANNRLVMFVGAGVSQNSGIPTWSTLVNKIAEKIEYDKCSNCKQSFTCFKRSFCERAYSQDEYLKIPEYFFQQDDTGNHDNYYQFIRETLQSDAKPNVLDDEIIKIHPHHIITTNFDTLLEDSGEYLTKNYTKVAEDRDLLGQASDSYLIKMHGDIHHPETLVLKESDYLEYEQTHPLIATFIRSLLINHSFMFVGYSLNDYNLKLIINWVNFYQKNCEVKERPNNFLITENEPTDFEMRRLSANNIKCVSTNRIPSDVVKLPDSITVDIGKKLYQYLWCINNPEHIEALLNLEILQQNKYATLNSYRKISYEDLININKLNKAELYGTILGLRDEKNYNRISKLIKDNTSGIVEQFQRAGITAVELMYQSEKTEIPQTTDVFQDELFALYINNEYYTLLTRVHGLNVIPQSIYYYTLIGQLHECVLELLEAEQGKLSRDDYIGIVLHKMRKRLVLISLRDLQQELTGEIKRLLNSPPPEYANSIKFIKKLFFGMEDNYQRMECILETQEELFEYRKDMIRIGISDNQIRELQAYAYD